jgi:hypothetical protein
MQKETIKTENTPTSLSRDTNVDSLMSLFNVSTPGTRTPSPNDTNDHDNRDLTAREIYLQRNHRGTPLSSADQTQTNEIASLHSGKGTEKRSWGFSIPLWPTLFQWKEESTKTEPDLATTSTRQKETKTNLPPKPKQNTSPKSKSKTRLLRNQVNVVLVHGPDVPTACHALLAMFSSDFSIPGSIVTQTARDSIWREVGETLSFMRASKNEPNISLAQLSLMNHPQNKPPQHHRPRLGVKIIRQTLSSKWQLQRTADIDLTPRAMLSFTPPPGVSADVYFCRTAPLHKTDRDESGWVSSACVAKSPRHMTAVWKSINTLLRTWDTNRHPHKEWLASMNKRLFTLVTFMTGDNQDALLEFSSTFPSVNWINNTSLLLDTPKSFRLNTKSRENAEIILSACTQKAWQQVQLRHLDGLETNYKSAEPDVAPRPASTQNKTESDTSDTGEDELDPIVHTAKSHDSTHKKEPATSTHVQPLWPFDTNDVLETATLLVRSMLQTPAAHKYATTIMGEISSATTYSVPPPQPPLAAEPAQKKPSYSHDRGALLQPIPVKVKTEKDVSVKVKPEKGVPVKVKIEKDVPVDTTVLLQEKNISTFNTKILNMMAAAYSPLSHNTARRRSNNPPLPPYHTKPVLPNESVDTTRNL